MKLSFIVPIYNVQPYLQKCVDSLLQQDFGDYEIILVDDGSTDGSGLLADEIALLSSAPSPTIRVIHQENKGLSGARNTGINAARGEYICFVDSDDYWEENVLGGLMEQIERDSLEVLRFKYRYVSPEEGESYNPYKHPMYEFEDYSGCSTDGHSFLNNRLGNRCYVVTYIAKANIVKNCRFMEGILYEDIDWTPRMLLKAKRVASTDKIIYNYLLRDGSITQTTNLEKKRKGVEDKMCIIQSLQQTALSCDQVDWFRGMVALLSVGVLDAIGLYLYSDRETYLGGLKSLKVFPIQTYHVTKFEKRKIRLANISPRLYVWLYHVKNKR